MPNSNTKSYVNYVFDQVHKKQNKGYAAKLKKADSNATEVQSWEILASWVNLEYTENTRAYGLIGSAISRNPVQNNGTIGIGKALWNSLDVKSEQEKSPAAARLRRILACQDKTELLRILPSTLRYLQSKDINLDFARLLNEILWFNFEESREKTLTRWAMEFFGKYVESENES